MIRDFFAKLVRRTKTQHRCVEYRVVLNHIAATVPTMKEDKGDLKDSPRWRCLLYDDLQRKSAWEGLFPPRVRRYACAVRMMSDCLDSKSRAVRRRHLANATIPYACMG